MVACSDNKKEVHRITREIGRHKAMNSNNLVEEFGVVLKRPVTSLS